MNKKSKIFTPINCHQYLTQTNICSPFPCREEEISNINCLLDNSFLFNYPLIHLIHGDKCTGKTTTVHICMEMSMYSQNIFYYDCVNQHDEIIANITTNELPSFRKVMIFDNFDFFPKHIQNSIISAFYTSNSSLLLVSRTFISLIYPPQSSFSLCKFNSYQPHHFTEIMKERLSDSGKVVSHELLNHIARETFKQGGTIIDAFSLLDKYILDAIQRNMPKVDINC